MPFPGGNILLADLKPQEKNPVCRTKSVVAPSLFPKVGILNCFGELGSNPLLHHPNPLDGRHYFWIFLFLDLFQF